MSEKQPRKKRRLEPQEGSSKVVPPEFIPLVIPNLVAKSSKDPNRGMYPRKRETRSSTAASTSSSFKKASELIKPAKKKYYRASVEIETIEVNSSDSDTNAAMSLTPKKSRKSYLPKLKLMKPKQEQSQLSNPAVSETKKSGSVVTLRSRKSGSESSIKCEKISNFFKSVPSNKPKTDLKTIPNCKNETTADDSSLQKAQSDKNEVFFEKYRNCYGLLGESIEEHYEDGPNYFEMLPEHILEAIMCQIPILDLLQCRLVCKFWNSYISNKQFMEWKKLYYRVKMKEVKAQLYIKNKAAKLGLKNVEDAFGVFVKFMGEKYPRKPSRDMYDLLMKNELAVNAELVLAERFPELCKKETKTWSIFALAILLSETVWDVYDLYNSLVKTKSECSLHDITDAFYCAATFLLYFRTTLHLNYGLHYRVYYALYLIENSLPSKNIIGAQTLKITKGLPGQQSIHSYCESTDSHLTYEQLRILNHCLQPRQVVKIVALAGTGKTTTLVHFAQLYPQIKFLNVMYNKAVCEEAKKRFPPNVTCKTAHSLAWSKGSKYRYKLSSKIKPHDIISNLQHKSGSHLHVFSYAKHVLSSIEAYVWSDDPEITLEHIPTKASSGSSLSDDERSRLLRDSQHIWGLMIDLEDKTTRVTHDVYLKLYQLSNPNLSQYQCIMVDEAQDCNPAMLSVLLSQKLPVILVGDPNQQIYGFRGARNALQNIESTDTYHLTKSFRFGPAIAYVASSCLESLKHITTSTLVGNEKPSYVNGTAIGQYAIIARTNVTLFNEAVRLCCQRRIHPHEPHTILGAFVGGISGYGFNQLLDICKLADHIKEPGYRIQDRFISKFKTFDDLCNYAKNAEDSDLQTKVDLVKMHTKDLPNYVKVIREKCSHPLALANTVFSTAHKSKGMEFDTVSLTDDYPIINFNNSRRRAGITSGSEEEEFNVIYVALTRAKTCLILPEKLYRVFLQANEKFEYPVLSKSLSQNGEEVKCINCGDYFTPHTVLALYRREMILSNNRKISGGALCMKCRTDPKVRTRVELEPVIMYLDPTNDYAHRSMASLVGRLPNDPPIDHNSYPPFQDMDMGDRFRQNLEVRRMLVVGQNIINIVLARIDDRLPR